MVVCMLFEWRQHDITHVSGAVIAVLSAHLWWSVGR